MFNPLVKIVRIVEKALLNTIARNVNCGIMTRRRIFIIAMIVVFAVLVSFDCFVYDIDVYITLLLTIIYPFYRTRSWYRLLPLQEMQRLHGYLAQRTTQMY